MMKHWLAGPPGSSLLLALLLLTAVACTEDQPVGSVDTVVPGDTEDIQDERSPDEDIPQEDMAQADLPEEDSAPEQDLPPEGCRADQCEVDGACYDNGAAKPDDPCLACLVLVDRGAWSARDGGACDDGDACTQGDVCTLGQCQGTPRVCEDDNPCTDDACVEGACTFTDNTESCDDGDACTTGDVCAQGSCRAGDQPLGCDDGNPCTADACDPARGCTFDPAPMEGAACDDGDLCTSGDTCAQGACGAGQPVLCDDQNLCTVDACDPGTGACVYEDISSLCDDDNACTDETCDPARGCVYPFNEDPCDDGDACTSDDACTQGVCRGTPIPIEGDSLCTQVTCDTDAGVQITFLEGACDDNNACTVGDTCVEGGCNPGTTPLSCDDNNACTDNSCDPEQGCVVSFNQDSCDDGDACTVNDTCAQGTCAGQPRGCDDGNACTADSCDPEQGCVHEVMITQACRPLLEVIFPPRAATLTAQEPQITVRGTVESGAGDITEVRINGQRANLRDGRFWLPITPQVGGNILVIEARDELGSLRRRVQSFLWSQDYHQPDAEAFTDVTDKGLGLFLSPQVLDDGDRRDPPNDFATIFDRVLDVYDIAALVPETAGTFAGFTVRIQSFHYGDPSVTLRPGVDVLLLDLVIPDLDAALLADGFFDIPGRFTSSGLLVSAPIRMSVQNGELVVTLNPNQVDVSIQDPDFRFDSVVAEILIGWLVDAFLPRLVGDLEAGLRDALVGDLGPLLADALGALALDEEIELPSLAEDGVVIPVRLRTRYDDVDISPMGMRLAFDAATSAQSPTQEPSNLGTLSRVGCLENPQALVIPGLAPFELVLSDDTLNSLLYSAWLGGFLNFEVPAELLGDVDLSQYNLEDLSLQATGLLQPTGSDCNPDGQLRLHVGDLRIDVQATFFGQPLDVVIYASLEADLELQAGEGQIGLVVTGISDADFEVNVQQPELLAVEPIISQLIEANLLPALLDVLGGQALGGFPLPQIDLSGAFEGLEEPLLITIDPQEVTREAGNTVVGGGLQ